MGILTYVSQRKTPKNWSFVLYFICLIIMYVTLFTTARYIFTACVPWIGNILDDTVLLRNKCKIWRAVENSICKAVNLDCRRDDRLLLALIKKNIWIFIVASLCIIIAVVSIHCLNVVIIRRINLSYIEASFLWFGTWASKDIQMCRWIREYIGSHWYSF